MARNKSRRKKKLVVKKRFFVFLLILILLIVGLVFGINKLFNREEAVIPTPPIYNSQIEFGHKLMLAARGYINSDLTYDGTYFAGGYPPDNLGVCTDVVWKGFKGIGLTLKDVMDEDVANNLEAYSSVIAYPDPNIDFRLVQRLEVFFERNGQVITNDLNNLLAWQPGDIVTFESSHVAVVSNLTNLFGYPYIIQHGKDPAAEEDRIAATDGMKISGHYRINRADIPSIILGR